MTKTETDAEFVERMSEWKDGTPCSEKSWMRLLSLARRAVRLEAVLTGIEWRSIDRDNMEYRATISCCRMDKIQDALAREKNKT